MHGARSTTVILFAVVLAVSGCSTKSSSPTGPAVNPLTVALQIFLPFTAGAADASGNGNDGTLIGGATASGTLTLGANAADMLALPGALVNGATDFTFAAWVRFDAVNSGNQLLSAANAAEDNACGIWYSGNDARWEWDIDGVRMAFAVNSVVEDGLWHHIAYVRSGTSGILYVDGAAVGSPLTVSGVAFNVVANGLFIGQDQDVVGGGFAAGENWTGEIDNLRIYKRALSAAEIVLARDEPR